MTLPPKVSPRVTWGEPTTEVRFLGGGREGTVVQEWTASDGARISEYPGRGFVINAPLVQNAARPTLDEAKRFYQFKKDHYEQEFRGRREELGNYKSPHWDEPNVLAHIRRRATTRPQTGRKSR